MTNTSHNLHKTKKTNNTNKEHNLNAIDDIIQTGIVVIDPTTHEILEVNNEAANLIGLTKEQIVGNICHKFICPAEVGKCPIIDLKQKIDKSERSLLTANKDKLPILKTVTLSQVDGQDRLIESFLDISKIKTLQEELEKYANIDFLTQAYNRRYFTELCNNEILRVKHLKYKISFAMFDIDYFKNVNDTYGHSAGDLVLQELAALCKSWLQPYDIFGRIGGEEFAIMFISSNKKQTLAKIEELRKIINEHSVTYKDSTIKISISVGATMLNHKVDATVTSLLERSDYALYKAKNNGRNRIEVE